MITEIPSVMSMLKCVNTKSLSYLTNKLYAVKINSKKIISKKKAFQFGKP